MKEVIVEFSDRSASFEVDAKDGETEYAVLMSEFIEVYQEDPYVQKKINGSYFPVLEYINSKNRRVEVRKNCKTLPSDDLFLVFKPSASPIKKKLNEKTQSLPTTGSNAVDKQTQKACSDNEEPEEVELSKDQRELAEEPSQKRRKRSLNEETVVPEAHRFTVENMPVPQLSSRVLALFDKGEFFLRLKMFVQETGDHFRNTISSSEKYIYPRYVEALMIKYPQIVEAVNNERKCLAKKCSDVNGSKSQEPEESDEEANGMSQEPEQSEKELKEKATREFGNSLICLIRTHVNNAKYREKEKGKKAKEIHSTCGPSTYETLVSTEKNSRKRKSTANNNQRETKLPESYGELCQLLSKKTKIKEEEVCKALSTFPEERWAEIKSMGEIPDVYGMWPTYRKFSVIATELFIRLDMDDGQLRLRFERVVKVLAQLKNLPAGQEIEKLRVLAVYEKLLCLPIKYTNVFTIIEVDPKKSTKPPNTLDANAPISATFVANNEVIARCFIRAKQDTVFSMKSPTCYDIYKAVIGTYYCFDRAYPSAFKSLLDFLDFCVLNREDVSNRSAVLRDLKASFTRLDQDIL